MSCRFRHLVFGENPNTEYFEDMLYAVDAESKLQHFLLSKRIPMAMGESACLPVRKLLARHGLEPTDVDHWVSHAGGAKVMELVAQGLGINVEGHMRHTLSVMRDYGNLSSGSFLVSLKRLFEEHDRIGNMTHGDKMTLLSMGPGATIEVAFAVVDGNEGNGPSFRRHGMNAHPIGSQKQALESERYHRTS